MIQQKWKPYVQYIVNVINVIDNVVIKKQGRLHMPVSRKKVVAEDGHALIWSRFDANKGNKKKRKI